MKVFSFILKKDMKILLLISLILMTFSGTTQYLKYKEAMQNEPYYSKTFKIFNENEDIYELAEKEYAKANSEYDSSYNDIFNFMYGDDYDSSKPPKEIPSQLIERLFMPSSKSGKYSPTAEADVLMLSQMSEQLYAQKNFKKLIEDQIENYDRNVRRGVKDEYVLLEAKKLTEDYNQVLNLPFKEAVDTRASNVLITYLTTDFIPFIAVFILFFHRFSSEIQSRRFLQFSISKYGPCKYTVAKLLSGFAGYLIFYLIYCIVIFSEFFLFDNSSGTLFAPVQVIADYELSPEPLTVLQYVLCIMITKLIYCLALSGAIMLTSFLSKKVIVSGITGLLLTSVPIIFGRTYDMYAANLDRHKIKIILSCDIFNMYHNINYVNLFKTPIKLYWLYFIIAVILLLSFPFVLILYSKKRGAASV